MDHDCSFKGHITPKIYGDWPIEETAFKQLFSCNVNL